MFHSYSMGNLQDAKRTYTFPFLGTHPLMQCAAKSRYESDFVELERLGKGGFGAVHKVRNKLDGLDYAVKKIELKNFSSAHLQNKVLREVYTLARCSHRHIVRYYQAWVEHLPIITSPTLPPISPPNKLFTPSPPAAVSPTRPGTSPLGGIPILRPPGTSPMNGQIGSTPPRGIADHSNPLSMSMPSLRCGSLPNDLWDPSDVSIPSVDDRSNSIEIMFADESKSQQGDSVVSKTVTDDADAYDDEDEEDLSTVMDLRPGNNMRAVLYIQMQLCEGSLKHFLEKPNRMVRKAETKKIFRQIVTGLEYVHRQGIIHRDLKPSNIFFIKKCATGLLSASSLPMLRSPSPSPLPSPSKGFIKRSNGSLRSSALMGTEYPMFPLNGDDQDGVVYSDDDDFGSDPEIDEDQETDDDPLVVLGDFGLAVEVQQSDCQLGKSQVSFSHLSGESGHTSGVGTETYASPEQRSLGHYNEKTDIYSLGIILFELHFVYSTKMEQARVLENLRKKIFPPGFQINYGQQADLILWMMRDDPAERPTATEILQHPWLASTSNKMLTIDKREYLRMQKQIDVQEQIIKQQAKQIKALQHRLQQLTGGDVQVNMSPSALE